MAKVDSAYIMIIIDVKSLKYALNYNKKMLTCSKLICESNHLKNF